MVTWARLLLNHPERHNSLGREQLDAISAYVDEIEADSDVRVLIVTGAGDKTFCAGAALGELSAGEMAEDNFQATTARLARLSIPTICAMNGNVFGGGVELAVSCDFRLGIQGMRMRVPAASLGLCYPLSGIERYVESLGVGVTKRILVASEEFDTAALHQIGFSASGYRARFSSGCRPGPGGAHSRACAPRGAIDEGDIGAGWLWRHRHQRGRGAGKTEFGVEGFKRGLCGAAGEA